MRLAVLAFAGGNLGFGLGLALVHPMTSELRAQSLGFLVVSAAAFVMYLILRQNSNY